MKEQQQDLGTTENGQPQEPEPVAEASTAATPVCLRLAHRASAEDASFVCHLAEMFVARSTDITGVGTCWIFDDWRVAQKFIDTVHDVYRTGKRSKPEFAQVVL